MKTKSILFAFLIMLVCINSVFSQNTESMPFKEFIEIADYLDEDDRRILRADEELMNSDIYFSFEAAKRAVGANVLALSLSIVAQTAEDIPKLMEYKRNLAELSYFPNLKFLRCNAGAPPLNQNNRLEYVFLSQARDIYNENIFHGLINCRIISLDWYVRQTNASYSFLKDLPLLKMNSLVKLSLPNNKISEDCFSALVNYPNLEVLDLSNNKIRALPPNYQIPSNIRKINLRGNKVGKNIDVVIDYSSLEYLNLSDNGITRIDQLNIPKLVELDISENQISKLPNSMNLMINLKMLNLARNQKIEKNELEKLGFLDTIDLSLTKTNLAMDDLFDMRFRLPNTALIFSTNMEMNKSIFKKLHQDKQGELQNYRKNWESGDFVSTMRLGKYFADNNENFLANYVFRKIMNPFIYQDFNTSYAMAKYFDAHDMQNHAEVVYQAILINEAFNDFKTPYRLTKAMSKYHSNLSKQLMTSVNANDSLSYYLDDGLFRIEYAALLFRLGFNLEAEQHFNIIYDALDILDDKKIQEVAKYFEENDCHQYAIKLYQRLSESPDVSEEKKLYAKLEIADIYKEYKDFSFGYPFVHYEGLCFSEFSNKTSKTIVLQGCEKAWDSYQDEIVKLMDEHHSTLAMMKKKVNQAANTRNVGMISGLISEASAYVPGLGSASQFIAAGDILTQNITSTVASHQDATADYIGSTTIPIEQKISFLQSKQAKVEEKINSLDESGKTLANKEKTEKVIVKSNAASEVDLANLSDDYSFLSLSNYQMLRGDYTSSYSDLEKAFSNKEIPLDSKIQPYYKYYSYEISTGPSTDKSLLLAEAIFNAHSDNLQALNLYSDILIETHAYEKALMSLEIAYSFNHSNFPIVEKLMFIYNDIRNWDMLNQVSSEAVEQYPKQSVPYFFLGKSDYFLGEYDEAIDKLEKCLSLLKSDNLLKANTLAFLGRSYSETGKFEKAESYFIQAMALFPDNYAIQNHYCLGLLKQKNRYSDGLDIAKNLADENNGNIEYYDTYALALFLNGNFDEAKIWAEKAIDKNNNPDGLAYEHYGDILFKLGKSTQAVVYWEIAKSKGGNVSGKLDSKIQNKSYVE